MSIQPADLIVFSLGIAIAVPLVATVLAFGGDAGLRKIGRWVLGAAWLACAAGVAGFIWLSTRPSSGIGSGVFLLVAFVPALLGFIWFIVWKIARRMEALRDGDSPS